MPEMVLFSNDWVSHVLANFSMFISIILGLILFILKLLAIINPNVHTDKIIDLIKDSLRISK